MLKGARIAPKLAGVSGDACGRGDFSLGSLFYGEILAVHFSRAASVEKFMTRLL